jgi:hypothetical protein
MVPELRSGRFHYFYWLDGRTEEAKSLLSKAYADRGSLVAAFGLAVIADDANDAGRRDQLLKELITKHKNTRPKTMEMFQMLLETVLDPSGKKPLDQVALTHLIEGNEFARDFQPGFSELLAGWFLKNHGQVDAAKKFLERSADSSKLWIGYRSLAADAIKRLKPE